jgi:hypothetical protein
MRASISLRPRKVKQKSCRACVKSKTACDQLQPRCSRCTTKGIDCQYVVSSIESPSVVNHTENHSKLNTRPLLSPETDFGLDTHPLEPLEFDNTMFLIDDRQSENMSNTIRSTSIDLAIRSTDYLP